MSISQMLPPLKNCFIISRLLQSMVFVVSTLHCHLMHPLAKVISYYQGCISYRGNICIIIADLFYIVHVSGPIIYLTPYFSFFQTELPEDTDLKQYHGQTMFVGIKKK